MYEGLEISSRDLQEEQERELAPEIEQERQLERPAPADPAAHNLHPDVIAFVKSGKLNRSENNDAFMLAFDVYRKTSAAEYMKLDSFPRALLATKDFVTTVNNTKMPGSCMDTYLRSAQWVLTDRQKDGGVRTMVIISPYEANKLIETIRTSEHAVLRLFAPRINLGFFPLDHLALYTIPSPVHQMIPTRLVIELMLFAGQPYFASFEQYVEVCKFLCLAHEAAAENLAVRSDGFIDPASHRSERDPDTILKESPVKFLKVLMTRVRRACEGIEKTHLGKLLEGAVPTEEDFEEV